ncbi:amidase family protein [Rhodococcus sp. G-MC3]|uniref:amidase n=1 Tax=Rhodococcus sp. G-MC3 TaxID=3046209 RepID=UPI0024BAFB86|nr:amidase family protein [Rhodococcus sp. G-MC3]MDJ0392400.1 amidase family protein [Rhodococcus sp. G-MC3]
MELHDYSRMDATDLKARLDQNEINPAEVRDAALAAISQVDPHLGATVGPALDPPPTYSTSGTFAGVPFALKDLLCTAAGIPNENGSAATAGYVATRDSDLMGRWRAAGLAVTCRTATPEFGFNATTEPAVNGPTRNPWNPERVAGGSSGGSAALVAAGALPWAHANDAGGSIRIPAALCGVLGLKPTRGLVPPGPDSDEPLFGLTTEFAITRTVRDAAALLDVVHGSAPGDRYFQPRRSPGHYRRAAAQRPEGLRIAVSIDSPGGGPAADTAVATEVARIARLLEQFGGHVEYAAPDVDPERFRDLNLTFWSASIAESMRALTGGCGIEVVYLALESSTAAMVRHGFTLRWADIARARHYQNHLTRSTANFFESFDLTLTPTTASTAWPIGELDSNRTGITADEWGDTLARYAPFTAIYNVTGQPAISIPTGMFDGLPIGVQLAAAPGREGLLLAVAAQLEEAIPWAGRVPPIYAGKPLLPRTNSARPSTRKQIADEHP